MNLVVAEGSAQTATVNADFHIEWGSASQRVGLEVVKDGLSLGWDYDLPPGQLGTNLTVRVVRAEVGTYEVIACSGVVTVPTPYRGTLTLTATAVTGGGFVPSPPPPAPGEPRYQQQQSPSGIAEDAVGEMSVGFNPSSGRYLLLSYLRTSRVTMPEAMADALEPPLQQPESCPAQWEDVSSPITAAHTFDPILFTDPQTGRTFVTQLAIAAGDSVYAYSDDDGDTWTQGTLAITGGHDHETIGAGPYVAGKSPLPFAGGYPNSITYCTAEPSAFATCSRSDDGGATFGPPVTISSVLDCPDGFFGFMGHLRYGADGTIYVPNADCNGRQVIAVSEDGGDSYESRVNPNATPSALDEAGPHAAIAPSLDGSTLYHCYVNESGEVHVSVSHDKARTWASDSNIGALAGIAQGVFPAAVAGDPDRGSCAFVGTTTPGNYQSLDFAGLWHVYIATTYDGGRTWRTVNATPGNPVQGVGGICTAGFGCGDNRNLLDFNEMVMDARGYPLYAYDDGCVGECDTDPIHAPTYVAKAAFARQIGGRGLIAQLDPVEPAAPHRTCLAGERNESSATLRWPTPDSGGVTISGYRIYRGTAPDAMSDIAEAGAPASTYVDSTANDATTYYYKVSALNAVGESMQSNAVRLEPSDLPPQTSLPPPGSNPPATAIDDRARFGGSLSLIVLLQLLLVSGARRRH
ncbi:MAG TPA: hypothetical protein VFB36_12890 [Nevskiaceae bacterium]|nr:hypothetical protein [Nevskiaceae bacterium]